MDKLLVWEIIAGLNPLERKEAGFFLDSPFFNKREDVKKLYRILSNAIKQGGEVPQREEVFAKIYPELKYDDQKMRLVISYLLKLMEQYLVQVEIKKQPLGQPHYLLSAYRQRKFNRHFQIALKQVDKRLSNQPFRHPEFCMEKYWVEMERYEFLSTAGRTQELNLQAVEDELTAATVAFKLRHFCMLRSHEAVFNTQYEVAFQEEILKAASSEKMQSTPAIKLYYYCYQALFSEASNDGNFLKFKDLLLESVQLFPRGEMRGLYLSAINFCIKKINQNIELYYREAHELFRSGLESGLLIEKGRIDRFTYNNIVGLSIRIPEVWEWVEWFVEEYRDYLEPEHREPYFSLSSARLEFARKNYDAALVYLQKADYRDLINNLVAKTIQMKIYFEKDEYELLETHLRSMHMFIRRNRKLGYHRENWTNIVKYTRKLMEVNPFDGTAIQSLKEEIKAEEILTEKEWLLSMCNEQ